MSWDGYEPGMTLAEACAASRDWQRVKGWGPACAAGDCRYAHPQPTSPAAGDATCPGYRVTPSLEGMPYLVLRYGLCPRHRTWWATERLRRKAAKQAEAERSETLKRPTRAKAWQDGSDS